MPALVKMRVNRALRHGRQAAIMPTCSSTKDHTEVSNPTLSSLLPAYGLSTMEYIFMIEAADAKRPKLRRKPIMIRSFTDRLRRKTM